MRRINFVGLSGLTISETGTICRNGLKARAKRRPNGQRYLNLTDGTEVLIAELVALTYLENCPPYGDFVLARVDGDVLNDAYENLVPCKPAELVDTQRRLIREMLEFCERKLGSKGRRARSGRR
jgi:hypothetical protein